MRKVASSRLVFVSPFNWPLLSARFQSRDSPRLTAKAQTITAKEIRLYRRHSISYFHRILQLFRTQQPNSKLPTPTTSKTVRRTYLEFVRIDSKTTYFLNVIAFCQRNRVCVRTSTKDEIHKLNKLITDFFSPPGDFDNKYALSGNPRAAIFNLSFDDVTVAPP